jgi:membrane protease YdiL (CAAX protease family)
MPLPLVEAVILYAVLFLPSGLSISLGITAADPSLFAFSINQELFRVFAYDLPSLALIWYLILRGKPFRTLGLKKPCRNDFFTFLITLVCLIAVILCVSSLSLAWTRFTHIPLPEEPPLGSPDTAAGWLAVCISCLTTGCLEESFFRFYLIDRFKNVADTESAAGSPAGLGGSGDTTNAGGFVRAVLVSSALFAICHTYEGVWGVVNAFISGCLLCVMLNRRKSLYGIALAHGAYNALVYVFSSVSAG